MKLEKITFCKFCSKPDGGLRGQKGAARILGLNPSTLRSRMLKLGIRRPFRSKAEVQGQ